jgi:hypothetical protein
MLAILMVSCAKEAVAPVNIEQAAINLRANRFFMVRSPEMDCEKCPLIVQLGGFGGNFSHFGAKVKEECWSN